MFLIVKKVEFGAKITLFRYFQARIEKKLHFQIYKNYFLSNTSNFDRESAFLMV